MTPRSLQIFVNGALYFFDKLSGVPAKTGEPFVNGLDNILLDYTGVIDITGDWKGCVCFTAEIPMLREVARCLLAKEAISDEILGDLVGEMANTIAGNAQLNSEREFDISIPSVHTESSASSASHAIPIFWKDNMSYLVVGLEGHG